MDWWLWLLVGWVFSSMVVALGVSRWYRWLRGDLD